MLLGFTWLISWYVFHRYGATGARKIFHGLKEISIQTIIDCTPQNFHLKFVKNKNKKKEGALCLASKKTQSDIFLNFLFLNRNRKLCQCQWNFRFQFSSIKT